MKNLNNFEIIVNEVIGRGLMSIDEVESRITNNQDVPFHTYNEWRGLGYQVQKGQKALFSTRIWDHRFYKKLEEWKKNGSKGEQPHPWKTWAYLFGAEQVAPIDDNSQNVKMAKGEVSEKKTRKTKAQKVEKAQSKKATRKAKKGSTKKVESVKVEKKENKSTWVSRQDENNPNVFYVSFDRKKNTRKAQPKKVEMAAKKNTRKTEKKGLSVKYDKDFYVATRDDNWKEIFKKVKGFELTNIKSVGIFVYKKGNEFVATDIASGMLIKSDSKLKDLVKWLDEEETIKKLNDARNGNHYFKLCDKLANAIA